MSAISDLIDQLAAVTPVTIPEDGPVTDDNLNRIVNSIQKLVELAPLLKEWGCPPVGQYYIRYPGISIGGFGTIPTMPEPDDLWPDTVWDEISSYYAGAFFRVTGGSALGFGAGRQGHALMYHSHDYTRLLGTGSSSGGGLTRYSGPGLDKVSGPLTFDGHPSVQLADETRPENYSVTVYRREA